MSGFVAVVDIDDPREAFKLRSDLEAAMRSKKHLPALPDLLYLRVPGLNRVTLPCRLRAARSEGDAAYLELLYPKKARVRIDARMVASVDVIMQQPRLAHGEVVIELDQDALRAKRAAQGDQAFLLDVMRVTPTRRMLVRAMPIAGWREPTSQERSEWLDAAGVAREDAIRSAGFTLQRFLKCDDGLEAALQRQDAGSMLDLAIEQMIAQAGAKAGGKPEYQLTIEAVRRRDRALDTAGGAKVPTILAQQLHTAPGRAGPAAGPMTITMGTHELETDRRDAARLNPLVNHATLADAGGPDGALHALYKLSQMQMGSHPANVASMIGIEARSDLPQRAKRGVKRKPLEDPKQLVLWATETELKRRDPFAVRETQSFPAGQRWNSLADSARDLIAAYGVETIAVAAALFKLWREELEAKRDQAGPIRVGVADVARVMGLDPRSMNAKRREAIQTQLRLLTAMTLPVKMGAWKGKDWTWHGRIFGVEEFLLADDGEAIYRLKPTSRWQDPKAFLWVPDELIQLDLGRQELEMRLGWMICREFARGYGAKFVGDRDLRRRLDWMLAEAGDVTIDRLIRDKGASSAKARMVQAVEALEAIGLDMAIEWNDDDLRASICRPIVSERLSLVHDQLAGKRLRGARAALVGSMKAKAKGKGAGKRSRA
jgi:hypothetical protein